MAAPQRRDIAIRRLARRQLARTRPPCHLCGAPIDYTLSTLPGQHGPKCRRPECKGCAPDPLRFEADHIVPLDQGGADDLSNFAASHRRCNSRKRARLVAPIVRRSGALA